MKPWQRRQSIFETWKRQCKTVYSTEEMAELEARGPVTDPHSVAEALAQYERWPSEKTYFRLASMYDAIPVDERRFCLGDQDLKDGPVLQALER